MKPPRVQFRVRGMMAAVALAAIVLGWFALSHRPDCRLRVVNGSGQPIARLAITVAGEHVEFEDLADNSSVTVPFRARENGRLAVAAVLADKTRVDQSVRFTGDPKRFPQLVGEFQPGGHFRLSLSGRKGH